AQGETAGIDVEKSALDHALWTTALFDAEVRSSEALAACAEVAGVACGGFGSAAVAQAFLDEVEQFAPLAGEVEARADLVALGAQERSLEETERLARRQALPDPTLSFGYVNDRF